MANMKTLTINGVNFSLLTGKRAEALIHEYKYAERKGNMYLWEVYGRCSIAKQRAYDDCNTIRLKFNAGCMYISGHNTCTFSLVYAFEHYGKVYVVKETAQNRFICEVTNKEDLDDLYY